MERRFLVESKSFVLLVLEGASVVRVEEKRQGFHGAVVLSSHCSAWLASTMETLLGFPGEQEFIKSYREGPKLLIARRGGNKDGRFLEAAVFGLGSRRGFVLIPEGRGGWGWRKFSGELCKISAFLSAAVGCGSWSSVATDNLGGKKEGETLGFSFDRSGPSYAIVVSSAPMPTANVTPIPVKVIPPDVPLDLDKPLCPMGKQLRYPSFSARGGAFPDRGLF
jgi:hypothetical protein